MDTMDAIAGTEMPQWMRAISWDDPRVDIELTVCGAEPPRRPSAAIPDSRGLCGGVPQSLSSHGCMWLEEGDESRGCGRPATWTMGYPYGQARHYRETHGWRIFRLKKRRREACRRGAPTQPVRSPLTSASPPRDSQSAHRTTAG
jgi:hypothetical protein